MKPGARVAAFVALLAAIFAAAALAGGALDPEGADESEHAGAEQSANGGTQAADHADRAAGTHAVAGHGDASATPSGDTVPAGVASSHGGYRLVAGATRFTADRAAPLTFRIVDAAGKTVRAFQTEQARKMHVIVVRRDLRRYQHLHPRQRADGGWSTPLTLPEAGVYRAFADFRVAGEQHTLGVDLFAPGDFEPRAIPAASRTATVDGYEVALHEHPGKAGFFVRRGGKLVSDLQPYLGARGHLVALREGDLAYEHVHPDPGAGGTASEIAFHLAGGEPGTYRLFLQFRHAGRVHTAAFTRIVTP